MSHIPPLRFKVDRRRYSRLKKGLPLDNLSNGDQTHLTDAALRESEAFYRQMFERNRAVKLVIDPSTAQILQANQAACDFYGYTAEQLKTMRVTDITVVSEPELLADMRQTVSDKGKTFQARHRLASGDIRDVEIFSGSLEFKGKPYLYGIIQDITEHKQAEKALRETEALYRLLAQNMPDASVVMFDMTMRYTLVEGPLFKRYELLADNMLGRTPQESLKPDAITFLVPIYQRVLEGESLDYERTSDGYTYQSYGLPLRDENGQIIGGMILSQDITKRKEAEKALHHSQELYRLVIQHMPNSSVFLFDKEMRYLIADGPFLKRSGPLYDNIVGKTPQEALPQAALDVLVPIYQRALNGEAFSYERILPDYAYQAFVTPVRDDSGQIIAGMILSQEITERIRAEKALRESEKLHHLFTKHMPNTSVVMYDTDLRYTFAEGPYLKRFGDVWNSAIGKTPHDMYPAEVLDYLLPLYDRALAGETFTFERVTENYAYEAYAAPVRDENEAIIGGIILSHDITKRKQAEKALRVSEELRKLFIEHMPNTSVVMFDKDRRVTLAEGDLLKRAGLVTQDMIGKIPQEVFTADTLNFMLPFYERVLRGEAFTYDRATSDFAYQAYANPLKNADGEVIGGMFLSHDITELKRLEQDLRTSEARFHSLVDLAPVGIIQTDAQGKRIFCNSRWCEMTGITLEQALGDLHYETIYPDDLEIAAGAWGTMIATGMPFDNAIFRYQRPDKSTIWVSGNGRPLYDAQGTITGYIGSVTDISENRNIQEKLKQERDLLRTLIDVMPDYIFLKDLEGRFILTNKAHAEAAGIKEPNDLIGKTAFDSFPPELARQFHADDIGLMQSGQLLVNAERQTVDEQGNSKTVLTTKIPWRDSTGQIVGLIGISRDITERKQLQDALMTSEFRFRTLVDLAPVGIVETDAHGTILLGNEQWHALSGIADTEAFIDNGSQTIHPDDLQMTQKINQDMVEKTGSVDNLEYRFMHPDGKVVWVSDSSRPLFGPDGGLTGYIVTMTDITERKRLEEELRKNEERLRIITDNFQDLITQSNTEGRYLFVSPSSKALLGYDAETLIGSESLEIVHPDDIGPLSQSFLAAAARDQHQFNGECRLRHADGHYIQFEITGKLLFDNQGNFTTGIFISRDMSERKRMQDLLIEREKLQTALDKEFELNNLKTRMMSRIAHEFRTPLTVIQASTETLTHYFDRLTTTQRDSKEGVIKGQILRLTDMLDEISLVMNGSFTPQHVHRISSDVGALCRLVAEQIERQFNQPNKFVLELPENAYASVDAQVLKNAILHVMRNAARFSKPSTTVNVKLSRDEHTITLQVTDNGIGVLPEEQVRIFEPFFRGSNISEISGLGVGLTIASAAIEAHDGTITLESVVDQGTTVTITIPD